MYRKDVKRSKLYMRWILGSEENEDDLKRIGKDRKIGITQFELVTICHRLSCPPLHRFLQSAAQSLRKDVLFSLTIVLYPV
jgi:hypothetical protein